MCYYYRRTELQFPTANLFCFTSTSTYCQLQQELAYLKPTASLSRSQQGVIKASAEFTQLAQRPCPKDSLGTYCIFSPLTLTFDFKVDRSDPGNFSVETNQRHLDKKRTYYILWNARAHGGDTICWRERNEDQCMGLLLKVGPKERVLLVERWEETEAK